MSIAYKRSGMKLNDQNAVSILRSLTADLLMRSSFDSEAVAAISTLLNAIRYLSGEN